MKYLYTIILCGGLFLSADGIQAQNTINIFNRTSSESMKIGNYQFKDGSTYTGEIKRRKPDGKGKTTFLNGDVYEGYYVKGKRDGYGIFLFSDGERFEGYWKDDIQQG